MIKNKIKVKCIQEFTDYNTKQTEVLAEVFEGNEYEAELYSDTNEYFARDHEDREFLVGELKINSLGKPEIKLGKEFELIEEEVIMNDEKRKKLYKLINILEIRPKYEDYYVSGHMEAKAIKGLAIKFDLSIFKNLNLYIPDMILIDEHLIKDYIIKNLEALII